jgi:hypothetical protein
MANTSPVPPEYEVIEKTIIENDGPAFVCTGKPETWE